MTNIFDKKFGPTSIHEMPDTPGVYLFRDASSAIIYIGKAANLRRRLQRYRTPTKRKKERKMRAIVRAASQLEWTTCASEQAALLHENELIQRYRPHFNVAGAYSFLYPYLGFKLDTARPGWRAICRTTQPEQLLAQGFELFGAYRGRLVVKNAYTALQHLLGFVSHPDAPSRRALGRIPFTCISCFRQADHALDQPLRDFLGGQSAELLAALFAALLEKSPARREASAIQADFGALTEFFRDEAQTLRHTLDHHAIDQSWIPQRERDPLFIQAAQVAPARF